MKNKLNNRKGGDVLAETPTMVVAIVIGVVMMVIVLMTVVFTAGGSAEERTVSIVERTSQVGGSLNLLLHTTTEEGIGLNELARDIVIDYKTETKDAIKKNLDKLHTNYRFYVVYEDKTVVTIEEGEQGGEGVYMSQKMLIKEDKTAEVKLIVWID